MPIDLNYLRRHYASLSDDALQEIDAADLVEEARRIYDDEVAQRGLAAVVKRGSDDASSAAPPIRRPIGRPDQDDEEHGGDDDLDGGPEPEWLGEAGVAASFVSSPGSLAQPDAAVDATDALHAARIPCYVSSGKVEPPQVSPKPQYEFRLMVPNEWLLEARSVLDKEIFNQELEDYWRMHFQTLSDEELRAVNLEILLAGLQDRIDRATRAYNEELKQRR